MASFRYNLSRAFLDARFVETGERPDVHQAVQFDVKRLSPEQRATLARVSSEDHQGWFLLNPEITRRGQPNPTFDRFVGPGEVPMILDLLGQVDLRESTTPITFRIHTPVLDRVRAYARENGLKTDGEALRALIERGLMAE